MSRRLPSVRPGEVIRALKRAGFVEFPGKGSHRILANEGTNRQVVVAWHNREMKRGTLRAIVKQSGLTEEEFRRLL